METTNSERDHRRAAPHRELKHHGQHGKALYSALVNPKLPASDRDLLRNALKWYEGWLDKVKLYTDQAKQSELTTDNFIVVMVEAFNEYKLLLDMRVVYDSLHNFIYRNRGQLKIFSSLMEEFLTRLIPSTLSGLDGFEFGSLRCVSSLELDALRQDPVSTFKKDQDFAISKRLYIDTSLSSNFEQKTRLEVLVPVVAVECKTYVDKTMFQESVATANRMKALCPGSKYFVFAEWLAMAPVDTSNVGIDRIFIARKAKRFRPRFEPYLGTYTLRMKKRDEYEALLRQHPMDHKVLVSLIKEIKPALTNYMEDEKDVLERGWF